MGEGVEEAGEVGCSIVSSSILNSSMDEEILFDMMVDHLSSLPQESAADKNFVVRSRSSLDSALSLEADWIC